MDKYQKSIFAKYSVACFSCYHNANTAFNLCQNKDISECTVTFKQDEDITKNEYCIKSGYAFEYFVDGKWFQSVIDESNRFYADFTFDKPITELRFSTKHNFVEPLTITVNYIEADKEAYYAKKEKERIQNLLNAASVKHATGQDLINIRFKNCCEEVAYTKIKLFDNGKQFMGEYKSDDGMFFKSIGGLAYGIYYYRVSQFDSKNNLIIETDYIECSLNTPDWR